MEYIAHINGDKIQSCTEHCLNTAKYAKADLMSVGLGNTAYLAGLIHDMGKFTKEFNEYIQKSARGEHVRRGSVIHSFAGVRVMMTEFHPMYSGQSKSEWEQITAEMIATAVGCHHGLFDEYDENHRSGLKYRIEKQPEYDERAKSAFYELCCKQEDIAKLFLDACKEICTICEPLEENKYSMLISKKNMIPQNAMNHFSALFKRVEVTDKGNMTIEEIRNLAIESCINHRSALIICNTKREARTLYRLIDESDIKCVHLSTSMCMAHRKEAINEMRELLNKKVPFICVSTQLIEAGVDVSFGCVIRFSSGIDSIVQAAGRCNRNGENKISPVYIVHLKGESLKFLNEIEEGKNLTAEVIREFQKNPEKYDNDLISEKAIADFYNRYFRKLNNCIRETEYPVAFGESIFELLSTNAEFLPAKCEFAMWQAYKTAGDQFEVFDDSQRTVVIPYNDEAKRIISELSGNKAKNDIYYCKTQLNLLKQYTVQLFNYEYSKFVEFETVRSECEGAVSILDACCYDKNLGIIVPEEETGMFANEDLFLEV